MLKENTNKAIAVNTIILYCRLFISAICGLLSTRFAFQALGINDFGLFSVVGSITSFVAIINTIMVATSSRFISVAIGKGDEEGINQQFNVNLVLHSLIALAVIVIGLPIGHWYIHHYIHYDGAIINAHMVYFLSIMGTSVSIIGVPFFGLLIAKEKFIVSSLADVLSHIIKLAMTYILVYHFTHKLLVYSLLTLFVTVLPVIIYIVCCKVTFPSLVKWRLVKEKSKYREVLAFSGWVSYGAVASVAKGQGSAILINLFYTTAMNTALGIANSINSYINMFAENIAKPIAPQVTKNYVAGNYERCNDLLILSTKVTFFAVLLVSIPFYFASDWIIGLWLGDVPEYATMFSVLLITDTLVSALNSGIANIIFASGKIKKYQIWVSTLRILAIILAYIVLKLGFPPYSLLYAYISLSAVIVVVGQVVLHKTLNYDNSILIKNSYIPSLLTTALIAPCFLLKVVISNPLIIVLIAESYSFLVIYLIGLRDKERNYIKNLLFKIFRRNHA